MLKRWTRFEGMGLQRRIMLYVTVGLAAMFGILAFLGLGAIGEATDLVFNERLSTAFTVAGIFERDFDQVAVDVLEASREQAVSSGPVGDPGAGGLLEHLRSESQYPFFRVAGVWVLSPAGALRGSVGLPEPSAELERSARELVNSSHGPMAVLRPLAQVPGAVAFATVLVRGSDADAEVILVHTTSINSTGNFIPASYGRATGARVTVGSVTAGGDAAEAYHLEVVDPDGLAVLAIGNDEIAGEPSVHYPAIRDLMARRAAGAQAHEPSGGGVIAAHVMAVVPVVDTPFYLVLEQPEDVALALPIRLRQELLLAIVFGFCATLVVAWVTTRHVVQPTERLTAAAKRIAAGDLESPVRVAAEDEIGQLAENLEVMRERLATAQEAVESTKRELEGKVRERTARLDQVLRQTISAQEDERRRLARELHDETAQQIAALSIALDRARDGVAAGDPGATDQLVAAKELTASLLTETRRLMLGLRPTILDDMGLLPAIRWYGETYFGEHGGIEISVSASTSIERLPQHLEVALFRIVQESLSNVVKHARASGARVELVQKLDTLTVSVSDDGVGFDVDDVLATAQPTGSLGLLGMQERVRLLGGRLEIRSRSGRGTTILVEVPLDRDRGSDARS